MSDSDILLPAPTGVGGYLQHWFLTRYAPLFAAARALWPVPRWPGKFYLVTRHDAVREVFLRDQDFEVPYAANLDLIMGGDAFFLGMGDTTEYRSSIAAMRAVVRPDDLAMLVAQTAAAADKILDAAGGVVDVVDYTRQITFEVLCGYFGITPPAQGDLRVWATRLFEFQFTYAGRHDASVTDPLYLDAARMAPLLRAHIDGLIQAGKRPTQATVTVLSRCLERQAAGDPGYGDSAIRCALIGFLVGGVPQPPMVLPQALEQLLRRPDRLDEAIVAARAGDAARVGDYLFEALRFDPLAPLLQRRCIADAVIGVGTRQQVRIPKGAVVGVAFASAMRDPRRIGDPERFDPERPASDSLHFGYGLHRCFGEAINRALLPVMLMQLLRRAPGRAPGQAGHLVKRGIFAASLAVSYGTSPPR